MMVLVATDIDGLKSRLFGLLFYVHKKALVIITQTLYDKAFILVI